jgi:hypothetical protein
MSKLTREVADFIRKHTKAQGVVVICFGAPHGPDLTYSTKSDPALVLRIPDLLRDVADEVEKQQDRDSLALDRDVNGNR